MYFLTKFFSFPMVVRIYYILLLFLKVLSDMPPKREEVLRCELNSQQTRLYDMEIVQSSKTEAGMNEHSIYCISSNKREILVDAY